MYSLLGAATSHPVPEVFMWQVPIDFDDALSITVSGELGELVIIKKPEKKKQHKPAGNTRKGQTKKSGGDNGDDESDNGDGESDDGGDDTDDSSDDDVQTDDSSDDALQNKLDRWDNLPDEEPGVITLSV